jgi:hypothetical protein
MALRSCADSEPHCDLADDERSAADVDQVVVPIPVAVPLEIEAIESIPPRHLESYVLQVESDAAGEALLVIEEPVPLVMAAGAKIPVVVPVEPG